MAEKLGKWLIIEPFHGGSHRHMLTTLLKGIPVENYTLLTMTAQKWHWRARCSALNIWTQLPDNLESYRTIFCSSVLSLSELIGMCPKLGNLKKIIYFHENQLIYPKQIIKDRDYQYGYNQITSCIAADIIIFNSHFNRDSFLSNINKFIKMMPDYKPKNIPSEIAKKSQVIYYPMDFKHIDDLKSVNESQRENKLPKRLCIAWAHRWEFDKNPKLFFDALYDLIDKKVDFEVVVMGESYNEVPQEFEEAKTRLVGHIKHFGYAESVESYHQLLLASDIIVSTADHEFFGVSMLEGVRLGCVPLVPDKLVYPEIYPDSCRYRTKSELVNKLKRFCTDIESFQDYKHNFKLDTEQFNSVNLLPKFMKILNS